MIADKLYKYKYVMRFLGFFFYFKANLDTFVKFSLTKKTYAKEILHATQFAI